MVYALFVKTNLEKNNILFSFYKNNKNNPSSKHYLFNSLADIFLMIRLRVRTCNLSTIILSETQIYNDGNKRPAVIFANHFLISILEVKVCWLLTIIRCLNLKSI